MTTASVEPVMCTVTVARDRQSAWTLFTRDLGTWWPVDTHSVGGDRVAAVSFEEGPGGRIVERWDDGTEHEWARVRAWDPPGRLVLAWHPNPGATVSTEVEVRFTAVDGGTVVRLEHRGWDALGAEAQAARDTYDIGWAGVLGKLSAKAVAVP